jgi:glycosyltransferase involved in cell wall biosynthesis
MAEYKILVNMIVKNESKIIGRCLDALTSWVDGYVISDTGSTDDTIACIEKWAKENKKIGTVTRDEWKNFGHNRTLAILHAKKWCEDNQVDLTKTYLLFLDADMVYPADSFRKVFTTSDVWDVRQQNPSMVYANLRMVRASIDIVCKCPTHEYYEIRTPNAVRKLFEDVNINDIGDGGSKGDKTERDIRLLKEALTTDPKNCRYWFYLANSYRDSHDFHNAILAYHNRVEIGGWFEETYCALVYKGDCHYVLKQDSDAIVSWLKAYEVDPQRGEALYRLALYHREKGQNQTAMLFIEKGLKTPIPLQRQLFLEKHVYEYKFLYELSICAYYTDQRERGRVASLLLLQDSRVPTSLHGSIHHNLNFYNKQKEQSASA